MKENNFYRNFGSLSNDSVVTDIYNKKINNKKGKYKTIAKKCITRKMTEEELLKYGCKEIE